MSVRIRMKMTGRKHRPFFRICVIDARRPATVCRSKSWGLTTRWSRSSRIASKSISIASPTGCRSGHPSDRVATLLKKIKNNDFGAAMPARPRSPRKNCLWWRPLPKQPCREGAEAARDGSQAFQPDCPQLSVNRIQPANRRNPISVQSLRASMRFDVLPCFPTCSRATCSRAC